MNQQRWGASAKKYIASLLIFLIAPASMAGTVDRPPGLAAGKPNIVVIMLDDVGFGDVSTFGGPAQTPFLDRLADQGLRYNNFNTAGLCSPTRASLLTGRNHHRVGFGNITGDTPDERYPGYDGVWKGSTASVAKILAASGYSTGAFGKWHNTPSWEISPVGPFSRWPTGLGFEYFYGFLAGGESQWDPPLYRNTIAVEPPMKPEQGYHFTTDITNEAIVWIETHQSLAPEKPYFLYFAPGAAHEPHHVPEEWIEKYRGRFDQGWDKLREETFARQKKLGIIPADAELTPRPKELPAWSSLPGSHKKLYARQMEVYAAFIAHTDAEIGRLLHKITTGENANNTLVFYIVGDNGSSYLGGVNGNSTLGVDLTGTTSVEEQLSYIDELGGPKHHNIYPAAWSWAGSAPFQWMKGVASHLGDIRNPMVVSWPARIEGHSELRSQFVHVTDIAATIYDVAGVQFPRVVDGEVQLPLDGVSFASTFQDARSPSRHRVQYFEMGGNRSIYEDGWMASARHTVPWKFPYSADFDSDRWELYHLDKDFSQARDVSAHFPDKLQHLKALFHSEAEKNDVFPLHNLLDYRESKSSRNNSHFVYHAGLPRISYQIAPHFDRSHRVKAEIVAPGDGVQGTIISYGGRMHGFALYALGNRLLYETNCWGKRNIVASSEPIPAGKVTLSYDFSKKSPDKPRGLIPEAVPGLIELYINGKPVGSADVSLCFGRGLLGIAQTFGHSVSLSYDAPFKFNGLFESLDVDFDTGKRVDRAGSP